MLNQGEICHLEIEDAPDMPLRGISDDISRGQISTFQNFKDIKKGCPSSNRMAQKSV